MRWDCRLTHLAVSSAVQRPPTFVSECSVHATRPPRPSCHRFAPGTLLSIENQRNPDMRFVWQ